jgi:hypothetical protein
MPNSSAWVIYMDARNCDLGAFVHVLFKERHGGDGLGDVKDYQYPIAGFVGAKSDIGITVSLYDPILEKTLPDSLNPIKRFTNQKFVPYTDILECYELARKAQ